MRITAILIDDDADSRLIIRSYLSAHCPDILIAAEGASVKEGKELVEQLEPDLLLLDIELPDGTAFDMLENINEKKFEVIFITAYSTYAIRAFKLAAIDYLLKPVAYPELDEAIKKVEDRIGEKYFTQHWKTFLHNAKQKDHYERKLAIATADGFWFAEMKEIVRLESHSNYTHFYLNNGKKMVSSRTMGHYEELLPPEKFCRIHHSSIVNMTYVEKFQREGAGASLVLKDGTELPVSQRKKEEVLRHLTGG